MFDARFLFTFDLLASKGFWAEMLGVGDFYYELGVQIVEVCMATNHRNGGNHSNTHCKLIPLAVFYTLNSVNLAFTMFLLP